MIDYNPFAIIRTLEVGDMRAQARAPGERKKVWEVWGVWVISKDSRGAGSREQGRWRKKSQFKAMRTWKSTK
jgi:hypothetical protein